MKCVAAAIAALCVALGAGPVSADPGRVWPDLSVRRMPPPTSLRMRSRRALTCGKGIRCGKRLAQLAAETPRGSDEAQREPVATVGSLPPGVTPSRKRRDPAKSELLFGDRPLADKVVFRFNVGVGLDGGEPSSPSPLYGAPTLLGGGPLNPEDYARLRIYYFGDAIIGSRGLMFPSLSTYLAGQFRFDQDASDLATAVPSIRDGTLDGTEVPDLWIRSGYGQWDGFFEDTWLKPLFIRAGRQYRYGPATAHFDGVTVGYDSSTLSVAAFIGTGVDLSGFAIRSHFAQSGLMSGADVRLDLYHLNRVPLVLGGAFLRFDETSHSEVNLALRWSRDILLRGAVRLLDNRHARTTGQLRARISKVTTLNLEFDGRSVTDWMYDLYAISSDPENTVLPYFHLGDPLPRLRLRMRAGTVFLGNIDFLVHGVAALRRRSEDFTPNAHATAYAEIGSAIEVRLRRALGLGVSAMGRIYQRGDDLTRNISQAADPLPSDTGSVGEQSFLQGGSTIRYSPGARKFSARADFYLRYYDYQSSYIGIDVDDLGNDVRGGGRFSVEGWAAKRLRLKVEYDLSTELLLAPELRGVKSLRVLAEGQF